MGNASEGREPGSLISKLPQGTMSPEIHPGDKVVLTEADPYYVGNNPIIQKAAKSKEAFAVMGKVWVSHTEREAKALGRVASYEVTCLHPDSPQPFVFFEQFLKKVDPTREVGR